LAQAIRRRGVSVVEGIAVERLLVEGGHAAGAVTAAGELRAEAVVLAAGPWSARLLSPLGLRLPVEPGKGYSITWDTPLPGFATPLKCEERKVVATPWAGGFRLGSTMEFAGYDSRLNRRRLDYLLRGAGEYLRRIPEASAREDWYGWRPMSVDELPILGPSQQIRGLHYACGHGQLGVSQCTSSGRLLAELMNGGDPHLDPTPFDPARFGI
jgi:D-amino-acid dehydrogenase